MVHFIGFINLFFIPLMPIYMMYRKSERPLTRNLDLLFQYCIVTAWNIPLAKVFIFLVRILGGVEISIDSGYYTLAALVSAYAIPLLYEIFKTFHVEIEIVKETKDEVGEVEAEKNREA